jgi:hypothetical protein
MANPETDVTRFLARRQKAALSQFAEKHHVSHDRLLCGELKGLLRTVQLHSANRNCHGSRVKYEKLPLSAG